MNGDQGLRGPLGLPAPLEIGGSGPPGNPGDPGSAHCTCPLV